MTQQLTMLRKIIKEKYYCGIDIGARTVKAGIMKIKDTQDAKLIGVYEHDTHGFKDNAVSDLDEFSECVHNTIAELTKKTGIKLREVQVGLGGAMIEARQTNTVIPLIDKGSKVITRRDVKKVNDNARLLGVQMEEEILHDLPRQYRIDDMHSALNPVGLYGRKLGVDSLMIVINENRIRNITKAVHQAGYDVTNVFFNTYASSGVVLSDVEKKKGCVLVDIGSQYTAVLIFKEGVLQFFKGINIGGNNFTNNIADQIDLPFDLAEEIKKSYAVASGYDEHKEEEILVKKEDVYVPIKRGVICQAIKPEVDELVGYIRTIILNSGLHDQINGGITVIGGGALLAGLIERIGQDMKVPVKLGQMNMSAHKTLSHTALFSSVVGLAQSGFKQSFRYSISPDDQQPWTKAFTSRVRELYQEYF
jgi:cell division protein FtsA